jgi:predicted alpha/beta hydrolase family esterase
MAGSKTQVLYIHGGESFVNHKDYLERLRSIPLWHLEPDQAIKWTKTLVEDLGDDYQVIMPGMPNRENAKYLEWQIWFERHFEHLSDGVIIIGCSLGAMFLTKYLSEHELPFSAKAIILMAPAIPVPGEDHTDFGDFLIDLDKVCNITDNCKNVVIMHSKDDFVVPFEHGEKLHLAMPQAEFIVFSDKNHFLVSEFPELIATIKTLNDK